MPIDIVPGDPDNVISLKDGKVQVAILSTATFDAQHVDVESLRFGPTGTENSLLRHRKHGTPQVSYSDVNGDGRLDLVAWFDVAVLGLQEGSVELTLTGRLLDGTSIRGSGMAMVVAGKGRGRR